MKASEVKERVWEKKKAEEKKRLLMYTTGKGGEILLTDS